MSLLLLKPDENRHCQLHRNSWKMQHWGLCVLTDPNRHTPKLFNILPLSLLLSLKLSLSLSFNEVKMLYRRGLCVLTDPNQHVPDFLGGRHIITIPWKNICLVEIQPHNHNYSEEYVSDRRQRSSQSSLTHPWSTWVGDSWIVQTNKWKTPQKMIFCAYAHPSVRGVNLKSSQ